ncbi:ubiquitin [Salicibibacter cibarius]|uniref:Ubiquitin n=1 Tax=Salicibibacter cibarius TaxID=2743000 RepID=A0A7T7CD45_9BACI|nr:EsaB/YukD family protein [Salicibibacter cibarius]QQK77600.1 ubiquitin [Salicibibacter cibarius]
MYIQITVDLHNYEKQGFDLRLSDQYTAKKLVDLTWKIKDMNVPRREGSWIRIANKEKVVSGDETLEGSGVTNGDRLEIL